MNTAIANPTPRLEWAPRLALAAALTAFGDWLFHGRHLGVSVALFALALAAGVVAGNVARAGGRTRVLAASLLVAGLLPLVETLDGLSILLATCGLALFATLLVADATRAVRGTLAAALRLVLIGPFRLLPDLAARLRRNPAGGSWFSLDGLVGWMVPVFFCGLFALLFTSANPLIDGWVSSIRWSALVERIDTPRLLLWAFLLSLAWAAVAVRTSGTPDWLAALPEGPKPGHVDVAVPSLLGEATVRRSLILFNLLFGLQSALDLTYLWGGVALPDGMTYAAYAHRGAYPLLATALLAACFVLAALRPGSASERSPGIRALVFLWVGQNVLLVVSSILRLDLYVATYSLTLLRAAAFAWMALVAVGLVLVVARIALRRSNGWLLGANGLALLATIYAGAFTDLPAFVADYNAAHSSDLGTGERPFDVSYAMGLGPQALPAVDRYLAAHPQPATGYVLRWREAVVSGHAAATADWRGWTLRGWRLSRYLATVDPSVGIAGTPPGTSR